MHLQSLKQLRPALCGKGIRAAEACWEGADVTRFREAFLVFTSQVTCLKYKCSFSQGKKHQQ